jgi:hypothetical protein
LVPISEQDSPDSFGGMDLKPTDARVVLRWPLIEGRQLAQ